MSKKVVRLHTPESVVETSLCDKFGKVLARRLGTQHSSAPSGVLLQYIAVCCSMLEHVGVCCSARASFGHTTLFRAVKCAFAVCCSMLQYSAVCCSMLQYVAKCCILL